MGGVHGTDFGDRHSVLPGRLVFRHSVQNLSTFASQTTASFRLVRLSEIGDYSKMVRSRWPSMLILAALSSTASAQSGEDPSRNACREDAQKLCAIAYRSQSGVRSCLNDQKDKLSAPCRQALGLSKGAPNPWKGVAPSPGPTR